MRRYVLLVVLFFPTLASAQIDTLTDSRDGKHYRIKTINNTVWMLDNLDYEANYSVGLTEEQEKQFENFNLHGRYYHFINADSLCPDGWRLPDSKDWVDYFDFLVKEVLRK